MECVATLAVFNCELWHHDQRILIGARSSGRVVNRENFRLVVEVGAFDECVRTHPPASPTPLIHLQSDRGSPKDGIQIAGDVANFRVEI
jgi:hypothetical protein